MTSKSKGKCMIWNLPIKRSHCYSFRWTSEVTSTPCSYGKIPHDHWYQPDWIDEDKATKSRLDMIEHKVIYGHSYVLRRSCGVYSYAD